MIETRPTIGLAQVCQGLCIASIIGGMKAHRTARERPVEVQSRGGLGLRFDPRQKPRNNVDKVESFAQEHPSFAH